MISLPAIHISAALVFWPLTSLVRNSAALAVYLLFSAACTIHKLSRQSRTRYPAALRTHLYEKQKPEASIDTSGFHAPDRIRTCDLPGRSRTRYPAALRTHLIFRCFTALTYYSKVFRELQGVSGNFF